MKYEDVQMLYEIKCRKYKPEQLTEALRNILFEEAINELQVMSYINERGCRN